MFFYKIKSGKGVALKNKTYRAASIQEQLLSLLHKHGLVTRHKAMTNSYSDSALDFLNIGE